MRVSALRAVRGAPRLAITLLVAFGVLLGLQVSAAVGAPQTQTYIGQADGATPDIERDDLLYFLPDGSLAPGGAAGTINIALDGVPVVAFCVETDRFLRETGSVISDVTELPLATIDDRAVLWIVRTQAVTGASTPEKRDQAAAAQVAIWVLRGQLRASEPTNDPAVNAAAQALIDTARAQGALSSTLGLTATAPAAGATSTTVVVSGKPGAVVQLAVTSGPGSLSAGSVTVGADGTATVTLASPGAGTTVVSAVTDGDGTLYRVAPRDRSQATTFAAGAQLAASASVTFTAAPTTTPTPSVPVAQAPQGRARLAIAKRAPARARVLQRVRYTITVRNSGRAIARDVVLRDRIPSGMSVDRSSLRGSLRNGTMTFRLGALRPGQTRTVNIWLRANATVRGTRVNVATASADNTGAVRARAVTAFRPLAARVQPSVTG